MTRELHSKTEIQRARATEPVANDARERSYEPRDAPAAQVAYGMAALAGLMIAGIVLVGLFFWYLRAHAPETRPPWADTRIEPPPPRLLETPVEPRDSFGQPPATATDAPPREILQAMRTVKERGWNEAEPVPSAEQTARQHLRERR